MAVKYDTTCPNNILGTSGSDITYGWARGGNHTPDVLVPTQRISNKTSFMFEAVTAYMEINTSASDRPMLSVYDVYSVRSGNLSLPYTIQSK